MIYEPTISCIFHTSENSSLDQNWNKSRTPLTSAMSQLWISDDETVLILRTPPFDKSPNWNGTQQLEQLWWLCIRPARN